MSFSESIEAVVGGKCAEISHEELLEIGEKCIGYFLQANYIGPLLPEGFLSSEALCDAKFLKELTVDSEEAYSRTEFPVLIIAALRISAHFDENQVKSLQVLLFKMRVLFLHQRLLENPSFSLMNSIIETIGLIEEEIPNSDLDEDEMARVFLEIGLVHHFYGNDKKAVLYFSKAKETRKFDFELTGALGKRTKFQTFEVSQLIVKAHSHSAKASQGESQNKEKPQNIDLNDDTLLEKIKLSEETKQDNLDPIDQCILLAFCLNVKNMNPNHGLTTEEMVPYVQRVLENPNNWGVYTLALLLRSRLEAHRSRTVERSALQLQALVDQIKLEEPDAQERTKYLTCLLMPSKWELERFMSIGVVLSALEIFERLEMWEDVVTCYQMSEKTQKAEELIVSLLEKKPDDPKLLCILGDLRADHSLYIKAWEKSGKRFARAQRSLGAWYYKQQRWEDCIEAYSLALAINPIFENTWFAQGCAALHSSQWEIAETAFRRVVSLNAENGEAWTNLASVYIKKAEKVNAWRSLKEALKHMYENGNVWNNFLWCSIDIGEYEEAIEAFKRVVELKVSKKNQPLDTEVLDILVTVVIEDQSDAAGNGCFRLAKKLTGLLEFIATQVSNSDGFFLATHRFYKCTGSYSKAIEELKKRYRLMMNQPNLDYDEALFKKAVDATVDFVDSMVELGPKEELNRMGANEVVLKDWHYQSRSVLRSLLGRFKTNWEDHEHFEKIKNKLDDLSSVAGR